jgi:hypothetical protein
MSTSQTTVGNLAVELGLSDEQFRQALAYAQVQAEAAAKQMQAKVNQAAASVPRAVEASTNSTNRAMGLLNISRALDDVQYGFRGIVNNIEGIVMGLGFGTGVAGAATIAAVAINQMIPAVQGVYNATQKLFYGFQDGAEQARMSVAGMMNGGLGQQGLAAALKDQAQYLIGRSDATNQDLSENFGNRGSGSEMTRYQNAMANNLRRAIEASALMQESFRAAADASVRLAASQRGAAAQYDLSTKSQAQIPLNRQLFQAAVDRFGNGDNLRTKLLIEGRKSGMLPTDTERLYGDFASGNQNATLKATELLGLQAERTKIMAEDFERITRSAEELQSISKETAKSKEETAKFIEQENRWLQNSIRLDEQRELNKEGQSFDRQISEYERAVVRQDDLFSRRSSLMNLMNRSEIIGAADVFGRNLNAGMKSEELKQLEEINKGIQDLKPITGLG